MLSALLVLALGIASPEAPPVDVPSLQAGVALDVRVDADLSEAEWESAEIATDFIQFEPREGDRASQRTEVRVLRGASSLYVGARLYDTDPGGIRTTLSRRDDIGEGDWFAVALDSYNDGRTAYQFAVTAAGVLYDSINSGNNNDESWDAVWTAATRVTDGGWIAEMEIPYSQLRFTGAEKAWGLNFIRQIPRLDEQSFWAPLRSDRAGFAEQFGTLTGVADLSPRRVLQAIPYSLTRLNSTESDVLTAGTVPGDLAGNAAVGADLKVGLAPSVILDLTINPDFGQVDADPAELNLSTFETFFSERRPFFLEGTQIFDLGFSRDGALLYTRRIGGTSPIIGAAKLTGRTDGGLSLGALASATGDEFAPSRAYAAARVKQELPRQSYVGAGATGYGAWQRERDGVIDPNTEAAASVAGAVDWGIRIGPDAAWVFEGTAAATARTETVDAVEGTQGGYGTYIGFDRVTGFVTPGFGVRLYSEDFRLNDVGRFRQTDLLQANSGTSIVWNRGRAVGPFRRLQSFVFANQAWRYTDRTSRGFGVFGSVRGQLLGYQDVSLRLNLNNVGGYDVRETRGLEPIFNQPRVGLNLGFETDSRRRIRAEVDLGIDREADGGSAYSTGLEVDWSVNDRLALSVEGELGMGVDERAWVTNEGFARTSEGTLIGLEAGVPADLDLDHDAVALPITRSTADALFAGVPLYDEAGYYLPVFGQRDTRSANVTTRANVLFSPTLSLQLYGQLFSARGQFDRFELLASRDELRSFEDYPRRRDFSLSAFNVNTVMRWEYRPGSSLYVVWTQARNTDLFLDRIDDGSAYDSPYDTSTTSQFGDTFDVFPDNVFLVKLSYLLM